MGGDEMSWEGSRSETKRETSQFYLGLRTQWD